MRQVNALVLNDVHIGAVRTTGTTLATRAAIQQYLLDELEKLIQAYKELIVNGDLFDAFDVDSGQLLALYMILHAWLSADRERILDLVLGNHDIAKNSQRTSSFAMLCALLTANFPAQVNVRDKGLEQIGHKVWVIPHCLNQDAFDVELRRALEDVTEPGLLLLHANFDNNFAVESDHSLNVSEEWARSLIKSGWTLVFAHEHQRRTAMAGQVIILGNQWPTSIADCLAHGQAQKDGKKFAHFIETQEDFGTEQTTVTIRALPEPTWQAEGDFAVMNWTDLAPTQCRFVRIEGTATAAEAADVMNTVARYRQTSKALIVTNSVNVSGIAGVSEMAHMNIENLQKVDVLKSLCSKLTKPEADVVHKMLAPPEVPDAEAA